MYKGGWNPQEWTDGDKDKGGWYPPEWTDAFGLPLSSAFGWGDVAV